MRPFSVLRPRLERGRMTVKLLLPAYGKHGCAIVGTGGKLRVVDRPRRVCMGYQNGCGCTACKRRELAARKPKAAVEAARCECDRPMVGDGGDCQKCGKRMRLKLAA